MEKQKYILSKLVMAMDGLIALFMIGAISSSLFAVSQMFPEPLIDTKFYFTSGFMVLVGIITAFRLVCLKSSSFHLLPLLEMAAWGVCTVLALCYICQKIGILSLYSTYGAGSFDNIAGLSSCLSLSLPLGLSWAKYMESKEVQYRMLLFCLSKLLCVIAIILCQSRTGMLCVAVWLFLSFMPTHKRKWTFVLVPTLLVVSIFFKSDSSKGRWFIVQRTMELIAQRPLFGWGKDGFMAHYMDVQAEYFARFPHDPNGMLADNVHHPLNEYLAAMVDFGSVGLFLILAFFVFTFWYGYHHQSRYSILGMKVLILLGLFSLFSYPFQYPFTWLMLAFSLLGIYLPFWESRPKVLSFCLLGVALWGGCRLQSSWRDNMELAKMQEKSRLGLSKLNLAKYVAMYPRMEYDSRFLFYYASDLYLVGYNAQAVQKAMECKRLLADYQLNLLIGDIYRAMGWKDSTLTYYGRAHNMCPSRFAPLYEMYNTCKELGDTTTCLKLRKEILSKPIKVYGQETKDMIREVKSF